MSADTDRLIAQAAGGAPLADDVALALAELPVDRRGALFEAAAARRDARWGRVVTFSPKVFLPLTNLCRNRCDYCSFRRSPGQAGEWTMTPSEITEWLARGLDRGCVEALFCLGDKPEGAFPAYRRTLAGLGHGSTVAYLHRAGRDALAMGMLPHTNAGVLERDEMARLREVNPSLGLMLETVSPRLHARGMPHHRAPDKRPERRLAMIEQAGELRIPFTTGILIGIGETPRERVESLLAIRALHRRHGHIQEVIVQSFRARDGIPMARAPEPDDLEVAHAVALARLVLDDDVSVQAPPNLSPGGVDLLLAAGLNDWGGLSPVTPDYINPRHPWPHLDALAAACARRGHRLAPRLPIYDAFVEREGFLDPSLTGPVLAASARLRATSFGASEPITTGTPPCAASTAGEARP